MFPAHDWVATKHRTNIQAGAKQGSINHQPILTGCKTLNKLSKSLKLLKLRYDGSQTKIQYRGSLIVISVSNLQCSTIIPAHAMLPGSTYTTDEAVLTPNPGAQCSGPWSPCSHIPGHRVHHWSHVTARVPAHHSHISRGRGQGFPELRWSSENDENPDPDP